MKTMGRTISRHRTGASQLRSASLAIFQTWLAIR